MNMPDTAIAMPTGLSPSSIDKYENCPLSFRLFNLAKIPDPAGEAAVIGTFVHAILEQLLAEPAERRTIEQARRHAGEQARHLDDDPDFVGLHLDGDAVKRFKWTAWRMIEGYFTIEDPAAVTPDRAGMERRVEATIAGVPVRGIIDRVDRTRSGGIEIADYKTGKPPKPAYAHEKLKAMEIYALLVETLTGERAEQLRLLYLANASTVLGAVDTHTHTRTTERLVTAWDNITHDCTNGHFQARPGRLCDWCPARAHCPCFGGDVNALLATAPTQSPTPPAN